MQKDEFEGLTRTTRDSPGYDYTVILKKIKDETSY